MRRFRPLAAMAALAACALALAGCSSGGSPGSTGSSGSSANGGDCKPYTAADIAAKLPDKGVEPVYEVTSCDKGLVLAFTNPQSSDPFFQQWEEGIQAAGKFYGITIAMNDAAGKDEDIPNLYQQLTVRSPKVYGTHVIATALAQALKTRTASNGAKLLLVDNTIDGIPSIGLPDSQAGQLAGETAGKLAAARLDGEWKGAKVAYVGLTNPSCEPCQARVKAGLAAVKQLVPLSSSTLLDGYTGRDVSTGPQSAFTDFLTAHPDTKVVAVSLNDESGVGVYQAAKQQHREKDLVLATIGGDQAGRQILRENAGDSIAGLVDANPFAEGWNWVAAAVALSHDKEFKPYSLSRVIDAKNVDSLFPGDS